MKSESYKRFCILPHPPRSSSVSESENWIIPMIIGIYLSFWLDYINRWWCTVYSAIFEPVRLYRRGIEWLCVSSTLSNNGRGNGERISRLWTNFHFCPISPSLRLSLSFHVYLFLFPLFFFSLSFFSIFFLSPGVSPPFVLYLSISKCRTRGILNHVTKKKGLK